MHPEEKPQIAALSTLILLQVVMLGALFTQTVPHPPLAIPFGGMAPFLAASLSAAVAALIMGAGSRAGRVLSGVASLMALVSYGPQKYFDPAFGLVWPAVIAAQIAVIVLIASALGARQRALVLA